MLPYINNLIFMSLFGRFLKMHYLCTHETSNDLPPVHLDH